MDLSTECQKALVQVSKHLEGPCTCLMQGGDGSAAIVTARRTKVVLLKLLHIKKWLYAWHCVSDFFTACMEIPRGSVIV